MRAAARSPRSRCLRARRRASACTRSSSRSTGRAATCCRARPACRSTRSRRVAADSRPSSMLAFPRTLRARVAAAVLVASPALAQLFTNGSAQIPHTGSYTEAVDCADIDGDGDWDAVLGDGGDATQDQNRLWLNLGGAQGGAIGAFADVTAAQAPVVADETRDVEFADFDGDGDPDLAVSNEAQLLNQSSRFWCNLGGVQGGASGFFADQTASRWLGLGGPGSSIAPSAVLAGGGFIDWTNDSDLADLDLDGDVDLLHSSHGAAFGGQTPSRVFLNDGAGFFAEFNPSLFKLSTTSIANGNPGLWCEGTQAANTLNASGALCDVASSAIGIELADIDGDFDVDLVHGARQEAPRCFANRSFETAAPLAWRDVTGLAFPVGYWSGGDNYEQEFGDMDGDGDVDLLGVNWPGLAEALFPNSGAGTFGAPIVLPSVDGEGKDAELCDYDGDGGLELYVCGFFGADVLYKGVRGALSFGLLSSAQSGLALASRTLMARSADVDHDGDYDVLTAQDANAHEILWLNTQAGTSDAKAPYVPHVAPIADQVAGAADALALAQVYDNTSLRQLEANDTRVEVSVNGCALPEFAASVRATQVARAELPGNLVGAVAWRFASTDRNGNTGVSAPQAYTGSAASAFAFAYGAGSPGSLGTPSVHALSVPFAGTTLYLGGKGAPAGTLSWLALTSAAAPAAPLALPGLCNVNVFGTLVALDSAPTDASGCGVAALAVPAGTPAGISVYAQFFALDGQGGDLLSSSAGLRIDTQ
ncbi:MAG: VCBS repeat-containing protein [Planctomycetota bacterium]|nr:MAG: VCBS repeat-containing protein [Planctomycetota bacterium]